MSAVRTVRIGTSARDGTFWSQGTALAALLKRTQGIEASIIGAGEASLENARRLDVGLVDLGFMSSNWIGRARRGEAPFEDPVELCNVAPANAGALFFVARADSGLKSVRDLLGRRVCIGTEDSGMVQHFGAMLDALGIPRNAVTPVHLPFDRGAAALSAGEVDAQWQCPYPNKVMHDLSERTDIRVLEHAPDDLAAILGAVDYYRPAVMPAGVFRGVERDTDQIGVVNIVAAHARTDAESVRRLVAAMLAGCDELAAENALFRGLAGLFEPLRSGGAAALEFGGVPLHPGALQAYRDAGYIS